MVGEDGGADYQSFDTEEEAATVKRDIERQLAAVLIPQAIESYEAHLRTLNLEDVTVETQSTRLRRFFGKTVKRRLVLTETGPLEGITPARAAALYEVLRQSYAVQTHHLTLLEAKRFFEFCVKRGHLKRNPLDKVEPLGVPNTGKAQLEVDESLRLLDRSLNGIEGGDVTGFYPWLTLGLDLRAGEIAGLEARHVNQGGRLLSVRKSGRTSRKAKTKAGHRRLIVPDEITDHLARHAAGRAGLLFDHTRHQVTYHVRRWCGVAGVPEVCSHGLRGTHATFAEDSGATAPMVLRAMGWESRAVGERHYIDPEVRINVRSGRVLQLLRGGAEERR